MKKTFALVILILLLISHCGVLVASAHSGGTDSKGGHTNSATGEYHYHHGYPAHSHPNGICPYRTNGSSGSAGSSSSSSSSSSSESNVVWLFVALGGILVVSLILYTGNKNR